MRPNPHLRAICAAAAIVVAGCTQDRPTELKSAESLRTSRAAAKRGGAPEKAPNRYIVRLRDDVQDVVPLSIGIATQYGGTVRQIYTHAIKGFSVQIPDALAANLRQRPEVLYVEQDEVVHLVAEQQNATWGIDRIDQHDLPLSGTYEYNATGDGVDAYIIDTGIRISHSDFGGRAEYGVDEVDGDGIADDCNGHGTHVSGTVGGTTWGVAKNVRLIAVRVLDCDGSGYWEWVLAGIDWVTATHQAGQPAVANMSLGGGFVQSVNDAITNSVNDGVVYAVAAGNGYSNACDGSPASTAAAITVGATDSGDTEADFSDRGSCLDIWAPGVNVTSAWIYDDNSTETISGTSMATPHVTGAAALYLQMNPTATAADVDNGLSANATTGRIQWSDPFAAKPPPPPAGQDYLLYTAFIVATPPPPPAAPTSLGASAMSFSQIHLDWIDNAGNENGFAIERCQDQGSACTDFAQVAQVSVNVQSYDDFTVSGSTTYRYRVRAFNSGGNSDYSNEAEATTPAPPPPPNAPSGLSASAASQYQIDLAWTDNSDNEAYFIIERCQDFGGECADFALYDYVWANAISYSDYGVGPSSTYRYRVQAVGDGGGSSYSNVASATTPAPPPPPNAPSGLTATAVSTSQIDIGWSDNSADENGFNIERCVGAGCTNFGYLTSVGSGVTSYSNTGLSSNTTYRYRVYAYNGNGSSTYSNEAQATTLNQPPVAHYNWSCKNGSCTFNSTSWDNDGSIVSYAWNFGDGTPSGTGASTSHSYKGRGGVFQVRLTVTDDRGAPGSIVCSVDATNGRAKSGSC